MKKVFIGLLAMNLILPRVGLWLPRRVLAQTQATSDKQLEIKRLAQLAEQQLQQGQPEQAIATWQKVILIAQQSNSKQVEISGLINIGDICSATGKPRKALEYYTQALSLSKQVKDRIGEIRTLTGLGAGYGLIGQPQKALEYYTQALPLSKQVKDRIGEAAILTSIGWIHNSTGQPQKALEYYMQSLPISQEIKDLIGEARTLTSIGWVYSAIGQPQKALGYLEKSLPILQKFKDRIGEIRTLSLIGGVYSTIGQPQKALKYYTQALPITKEIKDRIGEATTLMLIGQLYSAISQPQKALEYYTRALPISRETKNRIGEARTLISIGWVYSAIGQPQKALEYYTQALPIMREVKDRVGEASTLTSIGSIYRDIGQLQKALEYYTQALPITKEAKDQSGETGTLTSIGHLYRVINQPQKAIEYYTQALYSSKEIQEQGREAILLSYIGEVYRNIGQSQKAIEYYTKALPILRKVQNRTEEIATLNSIGYVYDNIGQPQKALEYHNQALPITREVEDQIGEALTLTSIGWVYKNIRQSQKALEYYNQALTILKEVKDQSGDATIPGTLAILERSRGNLQLALIHIESAIKIIENTRTEIIGHEFRTSFFASQQAYYRVCIDILMQLHKQQPSKGFNVVALQVSERARARSLLDLLKESQSDIRQGVDPKLLEQEKNLQFQFDALEKRRIEFYSKPPTQGQTANARPESSTPIPEKPNFEQEYDTLSTQYRDLQTQIRANSPRYAALTQPQPPTLTELQQQVLDNNTVLLEYFLGEDHSYLWAVTSSGITSHELPKQAELEPAIKKFIQAIKDSKNSPSVTTQAGQPLSKILLGPIASQLGQKRLLIVSNGALQSLPFAALPAPSGSQYLLMDHEIITLPSASTLATLRKELSGRKPATKGVAIFADPVFSDTDGRLYKSKQPSPNTKKLPQDNSKTIPFFETIRSASEDAGMSFGKLPATRKEAEDILTLFPANTRTQFFDFDANRTNVLNPNLSQYRIIHFATHGILNITRPELSAVVLSLVDRQGRPDNGFLRLNDIFNLNLPSELVVLSACETGLGQNIRGEGLVGLTRGFMYAGTPRVLASLWNVNDDSTAVLMTQFYKAMLEKGLPPAVALRTAQLELQKQSKWRSPYYWAAFTLQGEWK